MYDQIFLITIFIILAIISILYLRFRIGKIRVRRYCENYPIKKLRDIGETERLEILPLIDWYTDNEDLIGEEGVFYLIETDENTILFDRIQ